MITEYDLGWDEGYKAGSESRDPEVRELEEKVERLETMLVERGEEVYKLRAELRKVASRIKAAFPNK